MSEKRAAGAGGIQKPLLEQLADLIGLPGEVLPSHGVTESLPLFLTANEAASLLRISRRSVNEACVRGELPGKKVSGEWRVSHLAVLAAVFGIELGDYLPAPRGGSRSEPAPLAA